MASSFLALAGQLLLDAALSNGIELPHDCRAGHCGTCCVRLVSGEVQGGEGSEPGIVHACQCRVTGNAEIATEQRSGVHTVEGVVNSLRRLSAEVMEVEIRMDRALPYLAGQYAQVRFSGYPSRPFSITHPLRALQGNPNGRSVWFHVRRMKDGHVTPSLGKHIKPGHRVKLTGPYGSAHFRPNLVSPLILVATHTGFAPIWSIAVAALRENPERDMMIIAGGRTLEFTLYVAGPRAACHLSQCPCGAVCSTPQTLINAVRLGRPTDYLPPLLPSDVLYACGAPGMVDSIKEIAARIGAVCYADPFLPTTDDTVEESVLDRHHEVARRRSPDGVRSHSLLITPANGGNGRCGRKGWLKQEGEVNIVLKVHNLRPTGFGFSVPVRFSVLCFYGWLMLFGFAADGKAASDPAKIVGANACAECHKQEAEAWKGTRHFKTFSEMPRKAPAKQISEKMGLRRIKSESVCLNCHFTVQQKNNRPEVVSGISCESCHGAAQDWIKVHSGFSGKTAKTETKAEEAARWKLAESKGMIRRHSIYQLATNCYSCHVVPKEGSGEQGRAQARKRLRSGVLVARGGAAQHLVFAGQGKRCRGRRAQTHALSCRAWRRA